jgi:hypothetical protein
MGSLKEQALGHKKSAWPQSQAPECVVGDTWIEHVTPAV